MKRSAPLKRSPFRRKPREIDPDEQAFRDAVRRRSKGRCERCGAPSSEIHHRRSRSEKFSRWLPENGIDLCRACHHDVVGAHPDWAMRHLLILSRHSTTHPDPVVTCALDCPRDHR